MFLGLLDQGAMPNRANFEPDAMSGSAIFEPDAKPAVNFDDKGVPSIISKF